MKGFTSLLLFGAVLSIGLAVELPNVQLIDCQEAGLSVRYDKCLRIKFTNLEEYAGLIEVGGTPDVLVGKLYGIDGAVNVDSRVSVSIDEDIYYVMIHDPSDKELYKLKLDITTGMTKLDVLPSSVKLDEGAEPEETRSLPQIPLERQSAMPSAGFRMKVQPIIDLSWRNQFGAQNVTRLNAVMEHAKTYFKHSSLGTKYELDVQAVHNYPTNMKATSSQLNTLATYVGSGAGSSLPLANTYPMLTMRDSGGAAGIAFKGTVCGSRNNRVNINEYYGDVATAQILVHEIGHNLNMDHDFVSYSGNTKVNRTSSTGAACTNIDGYMDYDVNPNKWSPCSVEDITKYYNQIGPNTYGTTCMTLLGTSATTTVAPSTTSTTTAAQTTTAAPTTTTTTNAAQTTTTVPSTTAAPTTTASPTTTANPNGCAVAAWKGDGWCDDANNTPACDYDGGDCCGCNVRTNYCSNCLCLDPNATCQDCVRQSACSYWKSRGYCSISWIKSRCSKTCEVC